jgi:hypothetical protein
VPATGLPRGTGTGTGTGAGVRTRAGSGAETAGRLGRWIRRLMCRGHRPIIARTAGALWSARPNCR